MSFALALRNREGVLLAADTATWKINTSGEREYVLKDKIRWLRGQRAACVLLPVWSDMSMLVDRPEDIGELDDGADVRATARDIYNEVLPLHVDYIAKSPGSTHASWSTPQLAVVAYPPSSGPVLLSITDGTITERSDQRLDLEFLGAWNEIGNCEPRVFAVPWKRANNMARAKRLVRDLMTEYVVDYERARIWERTAKGHRVLGGPITIATITRERIDAETFGGETHD